MSAHQDSPPLPRRRRWLRWLLVGLALLLALPAAGLGVLVATFDPASQVPRLAAAVQAATGRALTVSGPVGIKLSLLPTIRLEEVALANLPGGTRPEMLRVRRVEVQLALLPLLQRRVEIRRVDLDGPDLLLERLADGRPNWVFAPEAPSTSEGAGRSGAPGPRTALSVARVAVTEGRVAWRDASAPGGTASALTLGIPRLEAVAEGPDAPLRLDGRLAIEGLAARLGGEVGAPGALLAPAAAPWPVALTLEAEGAVLSAEGALARGGAGATRIVLRATVPEVARFARHLPGRSLPPIGPLEAGAVLAGGAYGRLALSGLRLAVGETDLAAFAPGLRLRSLAAALPAPEGPMTLEAAGTWRDQPLALAARVGTPLRLLAVGGGAPWPVEARVTGPGGAEAAATGTIADPRALAGVDLGFEVAVPALEALGPLLPPGTAPPPLRELRARGRLAERGAAFAEGAVLRGIAVDAGAAGDLRGELTWVRGPRPGLRGALQSGRLDLDALAPPAAPTGAAPTPGPPPGPPPAPAPAPAPATEPRGRIIPATPLPLAILRSFDADLRLAVGTLATGGATWRDVSAHLLVEDGQARLDPVAAVLPGEGGRLTGRLLADTTRDPPLLRLALDAPAPGVELGALLKARGLPPRIEGRMVLDAELAGRGADLRAVAATLSGRLAMTMPAGGRLDRGLLAALPAELRRLLPGAANGEDIALRCLVLRAEAEDGMSRIGTLLLDTGVGRLGGEGGLNLKDEALALRLLPDLQIGGVRVRAPMMVGGTLARPRFGISPEAALAGGLGAFLSMQRTPDRGLQGLAEALGGRGAPAELPGCAAALAGRAAAAPAEGKPAAPDAPGAAAPLPGVPRELQGPAQELLRGLFGRGR